MLTTNEIHASPEYVVLRNRLSAATSITATEVTAIARAVTKPTSNTYTAGCDDDSDLERCLWRAWGAIIQFAAETPPEQQDPLIDVVKTVRRMDLTAGDLQIARVWGMRVWRGAPLLGACMRESWDKAPGPATTNAWSPSEWTNLNAFAARLTAVAHMPAPLIPSRSVSRAPSSVNLNGSRNASPAPSISATGALHPFDFSLYGLWTLRTAFESGGSSYNPEAVAAAETWTTYAGSALIKLSLQRQTFDGRTGRAGDGVKECWNGYSRQRLAFWLEGLEKAKEEEEKEGRRGRNGLLDPHVVALRESR